MNKIENYNVRKDSCCERYCDNKATNYIIRTINCLDVYLCFCEKHSIEFEEGE